MERTCIMGRIAGLGIGILLATSLHGAQAGYQTGATLKEGLWHCGVPVTERSDSASVACARAQGYVLGAFDSLDQVNLCAPERLKVGELLALVGTYLKSNPSQLEQDMPSLVGAAVRDSFPCETNSDMDSATKPEGEGPVAQP
jgi:hypothetical protein